MDPKDGPYAPRGAATGRAILADRHASPPGWQNEATAARLYRLGARPLDIARFLGRRPRRRSEKGG